MVGVTRLERATSCTPYKRSSHLNYTPVPYYTPKAPLNHFLVVYAYMRILLLIPLLNLKNHLIWTKTSTQSILILLSQTSKEIATSTITTSCDFKW